MIYFVFDSNDVMRFLIMDKGCEVLILLYRCLFIIKSYLISTYFDVKFKNYNTYQHKVK